MFTTSRIPLVFILLDMILQSQFHYHVDFGPISVIVGCTWHFWNSWFTYKQQPPTGTFTPCPVYDRLVQSFFKGGWGVNLWWCKVGRELKMKLWGITWKSSHKHWCACEDILYLSRRLKHSWPWISLVFPRCLSSLSLSLCISISLSHSLSTRPFLWFAFERLLKTYW